MAIMPAFNIGSQIERAAIAYFYGDWPVAKTSQSLVPVNGIAYIGSPIPTATVNVSAGMQYTITPGVNENGIVFVNGSQSVVLATGTPVTITTQGTTILFQYPNLVPAGTVYGDTYGGSETFVSGFNPSDNYYLVWGANETSVISPSGANFSNSGVGTSQYILGTGGGEDNFQFNAFGNANPNLPISSAIYLAANNVPLTAVIYSISSTLNIPRPNFYFSNDWKVRKPPCITVLAHKGIEDVKFSGDFGYMTTISAKWPGTNVPGQQNLDYNWFQINQLIGVPEAALMMRGPEPERQDYQLAGWRMSAAGRRLAVLGLSSVQPGATAQLADDLANNADMATFICDAIEFVSAMRLGKDPENDSLVLAEERTFSIHAYNNNDDSIFPALTFDGNHTLNWTFTLGGIATEEPAYWIIEKSVDGNTWIVQETLASGARTADISGTGTQYWRVLRSNDGATELDPESNLVKATAS